MKKYFIIIGLLLSSIIIISCETEENATEVILKINHYETVASGPFIGLYKYVQYEDDFGTDQWDIFYNNIENFEYEPGYIYKLSTIGTKVENPPADASSVKYTLKNVISKERINPQTEFEIVIKPTDDKSSKSFLTGDINAGFKLLDQINIDCNAICGQLAQIQNGEEKAKVIGLFKHSDEKNKIELIGLKKVGK